MKGHNIRHCFQALLKYRIMGSPQDQTVKLRICLKEIIVLTGFQFPDLLDCGDQCLFQSSIFSSWISLAWAATSDSTEKRSALYTLTVKPIFLFGKMQRNRLL